MIVKKGTSIDMTPPTLLMNTYIPVGSKPTVDFISKLFIFCELPWGIVRLPLLGNLHFIFFALFVLYSLSLVSFIFYNTHTTDLTLIINIAYVAVMTKYVFLVIFNLIAVKRLKKYYNELNAFDREVCCTPKIGKGTIQNIAYVIFTTLYVLTVYMLPYIFVSLGKLDLEYIPCMVSHVLEVHFIGHLLSLLIPRLRLINYYMELSLSNTKITRTTKVEEFGFKNGGGNKSLCEMEVLMNLYHTVIKAYTNLMEAIKWQLLMIITASFIIVLCYGYHVSYSLIKDESPLVELASGLGSSIGILLPLFVPCILGDQIHNEVRRLRELLASRLYENQMDKPSRGIARALLAWTETRDLSFSLLRMLNIDISLPFKFIGLLVTYLIILLQFQKVINP